MAVQCVLVGKGKDDVFIAVYGETTFDKVLKAYNENKVVQVIYQNRIYYLDNTTVVDSPEAFSFISTFSNQNDETGEIKHYVISLMTGDSWSGPFLQNSTPATHANTHAKDGTDPLTPADIGAMELSENILKQSNEDITSQVAQALSKNLVPFSGGTMTGLLNVLAPVGDSNATTKKYVDEALSEKIGMDGIGDLHVWKKTVVTAQEIPAGYNLVPVAMTSTILMYLATDSVTSSTPVLYYATGINISNNGNVTMESNGKLAGWYGNGTTTISNYVPATGTGYTSITDNAGLQNLLRGKFVTLVNNNFQLPSYVSGDKIYQIPSDATVSFYHGYSLEGGNSVIVTVSKLNEVVGYPLTPAGTITTYLASTNPNAYQEGNNAKPAGYTLGDMVIGETMISHDYNASYILYGPSIKVLDDGTVNIVNGVDEQVGSADISPSWSTKYSNKFIQCHGETNSNLTNYGKIMYIPSDGKVCYKVDNTGQAGIFIDRYQPVTGYAAIPANTIIEYLGKLGDKARAQIVSYVGTGTHGSSNPNSLTFDFVPKLVIISSAPVQNSYVYIAIMVPDAGIYSVVMSTNLGYESRTPGGSGIVTKNNKTITFYSGDNTAQLNGSGIKYYAAAIG